MTQRLRVAGGWPRFEARFEARFDASAFPVLDVSEEGFQLDVADGALPPERARVSIRRNGEERQHGVARRVWIGERSAGFRFEAVAALEPESLLAGSRSAARLRRRLRL